MAGYGRAAERSLADGGGDWGADDADREASLRLTDRRDSAASLVFVDAPSGELPDDAVLVVPASCTETTRHPPARSAASVSAADSRAGGMAAEAATTSSGRDRSRAGAAPADAGGEPTDSMRASWPALRPGSPQGSAARSPPRLAGGDEAAAADAGDSDEEYAAASTREWLRQLSGGDVPDPPAELAREAAEELAGGRSVPERASLWPCASVAGPTSGDIQLADTQRGHAHQTDAAESLRCAPDTPAEAVPDSWPAPAGCSAATCMSPALQAPVQESAMGTRQAAPQGAGSMPAGLARGEQEVADEDAATVTLQNGCSGVGTDKAAGFDALPAGGLAGDEVQGPAAAGAHRLASRARWHTLLPQSWLG